jgi:periplasmic protein CpxP/Spy
MKTAIGALVLLGLSAAPAAAHEQPSENAKTCEVIHDGKKMQGMMMKDKDGRMTCKMMDHAKMQHGQMKGKTQDEKPAKPQGSHKHD